MSLVFPCSTPPPPSPSPSPAEDQEGDGEPGEGGDIGEGDEEDLDDIVEDVGDDGDNGDSEEEEDGMWEEKFKTHADSKPYGRPSPTVTSVLCHFVKPHEHMRIRNNIIACDKVSPLVIIFAPTCIKEKKHCLSLATVLVPNSTRFVVFNTLRFSLCVLGIGSRKL